MEVCAAETRFTPNGLRVRYVGPDKTVYDDGFKEAYVDRFLAKGSRVIYMGNGLSDIPSAIKRMTASRINSRFLFFIECPF